MSTITDKSTWPHDSQEARMNKGPLVRAQWPDGHFTKMYEQDAIAQGLLPGAKARPPAENKMLTAQGNKAARVDAQAVKASPPADMSAAMSPTGQPMPELDDFTTIDGVGLGIARSLAARGIKSFAQLRASTDLSFLSKKAQAAIEAWRSG